MYTRRPSHRRVLRLPARSRRDPHPRDRRRRDGQRLRDVRPSRSHLPSPGLRVTSTTVGERCVVGVAGDVDIASVGTLQEAVDAVLHASERDIWIDLSATTFLATCGLHVLLGAARRLEHDHRRLAVLVPPGPALRVLQLTGADRALPLVSARPV